MRRSFVCAASLVMLLYPALVGFGETPEGRNRKGNRLYRKGQYDEALTEYRGAQVLAPELAALMFNAGNALYRKGELPDALKEYAAAGAVGDAELASAALYNAGTAFLQAGQIDTAVEAFKGALKLNPDDLEAKHNLEVALKLLEQQQQQQQDQEQQDQDQQNQDQQNQDQQNQDQQDQDQQSQDQQNQDQQDQDRQDQDQQDQDQQNQDHQEQQGDQEQGQQPQEQQEGAMSKEEAERLLDAIEAAEAELQAELRAAKARQRDKVEKDW